MKRFFILAALVCLTVPLNANQGCFPPVPHPFVAFVGKAIEPNFVRYTFSVANHALFPNVLFKADPQLPPCGLNHNASRTWLDIFDVTGAYIYRYCALKTSADMTKLTFAVPRKSPQPKAFYITVEDRFCHSKQKSNVVAIP